MIPAEAIRLAALGFLAEGPWRYGELAQEVRRFTSRIAAPSLDLMGSSLELLIHEGLAQPSDGTGMVDNALLTLTPDGQAQLKRLLQQPLKGVVGDFNRLSLLLKLRFLDALDAADQRTQRDVIAAAIQTELDRLTELRKGDAGAPREYFDWLDADIARLMDRLAALKP